MTPQLLWERRPCEYVSMNSVNAVTTVTTVCLIVSEEETQEIGLQGISETEVNSEQHQLQQQLQQANETIAKLLEQRKPTSQSQSKLFHNNSVSALSV